MKRDGFDMRQAGGRFVRRDFLKTTGLGALALLASRGSLMAGPFSRPDFSRLVPEDKKLRPEWVRSLHERGTREVLSGDELKYVGMPVGGICTGQLYLGGDGKLWHWDIFNKHMGTGANNYAHPPAPDFPIEQGFAVRVGDEVRTLDKKGFSDISFRGEYPVGVVEFRDSKSQLEISLEAFSPYIPLNTDDSSLPATVMQFTMKNVGAKTVEAEIGGWLENAVCRHSAEEGGFVRRNRIKSTKHAVLLECSAEAASDANASKRPDIVFENFEKETFEGWAVEGTAFGDGPVLKSAIPDYQGDVGGDGKRVVNSHASAPGADVGGKDNATGKLTSREFAIERHYIGFFIGGGKNPGKTCLNLVVDGAVAASATGADDNMMHRVSLDVRRFEGKTGRIEVVDNKAGAWGNVGVDHIVFSDSQGTSQTLEGRPDFGSMSLALLAPEKSDAGRVALPGEQVALQMFPSRPDAEKGVTRPAGETLIGGVTRKCSIPAGAIASTTFVIAWHFPNHAIKGARDRGRFYATKFSSAAAVTEYIAGNFVRLAAQTKLWRDTWYDSTLPYWFLDRTHLNTSILATSTCFRFDTGRFWAWEGVGCCPGTCGHVWHYAHAVGRLFPELERILREKTDFGLALKSDGAILFRGENNGSPAVDSQAGSILRALREHQVSADDAFLKRIWPGVKKATEWLIAKDADGDGIIVSNQHNTLDADWFGPVAWLSGLYLASLLAAAQMADEMGDADFATTCRTIVAAGQANIVRQLFDGEYFINRPDPAHANDINSGTGCEIDQVMGQSWAFQIGLPRVFPQKETRSALASLWKYNFSPDVGPYREHYKPGRWYAMAGEAGMLMCTFPRTDWDYDKAKGKGPDWAAGYFNECMNGFEYQVAGHMIWEGMVQEGLAVTRAVHDRYHASRRNPYNEVECGDHYARSMASYGVYLAACGFEYHGPKAHIGFAPRLTPENFRCAFTGAEGWGTFSQTKEIAILNAGITVKFGRLKLQTVALSAPSAMAAIVGIGARTVAAKLSLDGDRALIAFGSLVELNAGETLTVRLTI